VLAAWDIDPQIYATASPLTRQPPLPLVAAVTNPQWEPGRDKHVQYREHILASLQASPWARVIKASDFTDNAVGIIHMGPKLTKLARKYGPLVADLRELHAGSRITPGACTPPLLCARAEVRRLYGGGRSGHSRR
jgi:hypothetical protein